MEFLGGLIDKGLFLAIGAYFIFISYSKKEKLGSKMPLVRFCGIMLLGIGTFQLIIFLFAG